MITAGYSGTLVELPDGSPFSLADLVTLAYLIENREPGEWARFDYSKAEDDSGTRGPVAGRRSGQDSGSWRGMESSRRRRSGSRASAAFGRSTG